MSSERVIRALVARRLRNKGYLLREIGVMLGRQDNSDVPVNLERARQMVALGDRFRAHPDYDGLEAETREEVQTTLLRIASG